MILWAVNTFVAFVVMYSIWVAIQTSRIRKEHYRRMSEYDERIISHTEQEMLKKKQEELKLEEKQKEQEQQVKQRNQKDKQSEEIRFSEERQKEYERTQKEINAQQINRENIRKAQEELKNNQSKREPESKRTEFKNKEQVSQSQELMDLANLQRGFETQIKVTSQVKAEYRQMIEKHDYLKDKVDTLDKLEKSIAECKDKALMKKYKATKEGIEQDIGRETGIYRDKPKLFQSKARTKNKNIEYRDRLNDRLQYLGEQKKYAEKSLAEYNTPQKEVDFTAHKSAIQGRVQEHAKAQEHDTTSRSR